jgi:NAD(P)H-hydrate epimerase
MEVGPLMALFLRQYNDRMALPVLLYSSAQVRALDAHAIEVLGIPGYTLMKRAGESALRHLRSRWPMAHRIAIVCGGGNNGGDGYVLARFAQAAGLTVTTLAASDPGGLGGAARQAFEDYRSSGARAQPFAAPPLRDCEIVVDALLGIGLHGAVRSGYAQVIHAINQCGRPVYALDVPSGLDSDAGVPLGEAVRADCTVTFVGLKTGLLVGDGPEYSGTVFFDDLELTPPPGEFLPRLTRIIEGEIPAALPRRRRGAHKGDFGRVLIVGSGSGMPGATRLAGESCLRVGAGLTTVAAAPENVAAITAGRPELICLALTEPRALVEEALARADVVAIGPGLGRSPWARAALDMVLSADKPLVVDADALNLLAEADAPARADWILTPHPGEAARLLGTTTQEVQNDRLTALDRLLARYGGTIVLKGAGTLVGATGRTPGVCERGNPGMASAGTGDVLTGAIAGILAQCHDPWVAARVGVLAHAMAGDAAARRGERGVLASDVARELHHAVNL